MKAKSNKDITTQKCKNVCHKTSQFEPITNQIGKT